MVRMIVRKSLIDGVVEAPPSKSYTHRAVICASLSNETTVISKPLLSEDIKATLEACTAIGAGVLKSNSEKIVIKGNLGKIKLKKNGIYCSESASTLRFMIPIAALSGEEIVFEGKPGLAKRPVGDLLKALEKLGVEAHYLNPPDCLPLRIKGKLKSGGVEIPGNVSSQFISGLLFALPLTEGDSEIRIITEVESKDYILMTIQMLKHFGVEVEYSNDLRFFKIRGGQKYVSKDYTVEGDYSSAAFIVASGVLAGKVTVANLKSDSAQGDKRIVDILRSMKARIRVEENSVRVEKSELRGVEVDGSEIPDLVPILSVISTQAEGKTIIKNLGRLRIKESDRLEGTAELIKSLGGRVKVEDDSLAITKTSLKGGEVETPADHRLVMSACVAGLIAENETVVSNPTSIKKSYPDFFDDLRRIGGDVMALSNALGNNLKLSVFGESHGKRIGLILKGVPAGVEVSEDFIKEELERRRSTTSLTTARKEEDAPKIISGIRREITTGEEIRIEIENKEVKSESYERTKYLPRPGHADFTARQKYASVFDYRGGGFLSGRMTACFVAAGAVAKKIIEKSGVKVLAHTIQVGGVKLETNPSDEEIELKRFSSPTHCVDEEKAKEMEELIEKTKIQGDSLGGIVECRILNLPLGVGEPVFESMESEIAKAVFSIPAVKGIDFGAGFKAAEMKGSEHNDCFEIKNGSIITKTNNSGGILGGISDGMPVVFRMVIKPTSSIAREQDTVDLKDMENAKIIVSGRHDPCIAIRVPPIVEAVTAFVIADFMNYK